jgi:glycosyltransferase involved in cell wall biosynthesis
MTAPLLLHVYATFAVGGPQVRFAALANRFGPAFRHAIIAMDGNTACRERLDPGLAVTFPQVEIRKGDSWGNRTRFRALLRTLRPDRLVTSNWGSIEWAMANTPAIVPHLHVEDGFGPEEHDRQLPRRVWTRRLLLRRATVAVPSQRLFAIARDIWRLPPARLHYVPNGVDLTRFHPVPPAARAIPVIGTVAALRPEKNLARLIRAFAQVAARHPCRLVIAGDGPERPALEALAVELGLPGTITFTGHVPDTSSLYAGFDLFALSSDTEQMPIAVLEAMASGLPVAATDVGDVRAMLAPENGRFVTQVDEAALAADITGLLALPDRGHGLGAANRARAEAAFDESTMFAAWRRLFLGQNPSATPALASRPGFGYTGPSQPPHREDHA